MVSSKCTKGASGGGTSASKWELDDYVFHIFKRVITIQFVRTVLTRFDTKAIKDALPLPSRHHQSSGTDHRCRPKQASQSAFRYLSGQKIYNDSARARGKTMQFTWY